MDMEEEEEDRNDAIHLQFIYNNEESNIEASPSLYNNDDNLAHVEEQRKEAVRLHSTRNTWVYKKEKKPDTLLTTCTIAEPPLCCEKCGMARFEIRYGPRNIFGGYCFPCDAEAAFEEGRKRSQTQKYTWMPREEYMKTIVTTQKPRK